MKEATRLWRAAHARCISNKTAVGWEGYTNARKKVKNMVRKKKGGYGKM